MGVFDLRCGLSRLSVSSRTRPEHFHCAMLLLEELDGMYVPATPPVTGIYDSYGRIELDRRVEPEHAEWVGAMLELLWETGALVSPHPDQLSYNEDLGGPAAMYLGHAADGLFNQYALALNGGRVVPCIYRVDVADAIADSPRSAPSAAEQALLDLPGDAGDVAVYADWLEQHGRRLEAMFVRRSHARAQQGIFDAPPATSRPILERFRRVLRYAAAHGGLRPIAPDDGGQPGAAELDAMAQEAWDSGDPVVRELLDGWARADAVDAERELPFHETAAERAHAARRVTLDTVARVLRDDAIVAAIDRSPARDQVLELLRVARPAAPAALAETDGTVTHRGTTLVVTHLEYPDYPQEVAIAGREVLVTDGAHVTAGEPLTAGTRSIHEAVRILGTRAAAGELVAQLAPLVDLPRDQLDALVLPMFGHIALDQTRLRVTAPTFESWLDAAVARGHHLRADALITSYATLDAHVDPTIDDVIEAMQQLDDAGPIDRDAYRMRITR